MLYRSPKYIKETMSKRKLLSLTEEDKFAMLPTEATRPLKEAEKRKLKIKKTFSHSGLIGGNPKALRELRMNAALSPHVNNTCELRDNVDQPDLTKILIDIRKRKEEQAVNRTNSVIEDGFLYLVTSPAYPGWTKVGQTSDYEKRLQTYQTASPYSDYQMPVKKWVENRIEAERKFLSLASLVFEVHGEWINATIEELKIEF